MATGAVGPAPPHCGSWQGRTAPARAGPGCCPVLATGDRGTAVADLSGRRGGRRQPPGVGVPPARRGGFAGHRCVVGDLRGRQTGGIGKPDRGDLRAGPRRGRALAPQRSCRTRIVASIRPVAAAQAWLCMPETQARAISPCSRSRVQRAPGPLAGRAPSAPAQRIGPARTGPRAGNPPSAPVPSSRTLPPTRRAVRCSGLPASMPRAQQRCATAARSPPLAGSSRGGSATRPTSSATRPVRPAPSAGSRRSWARLPGRCRGSALLSHSGRRQDAPSP